MILIPVVKILLKTPRRLLFDLAEKGSFNSSLVKFDDAMKQTIEMASAAYKNEGWYRW